MALETTTVITGLNETNPTTGDPLQQGDDHIRLIKAVLKNCFPNVNAPLTASMIPNVPTGGIAAITLQAAIDELDSEKANNNGTGATGTWGISISGNAASATSLSGTTTAAVPSSALGSGTPSAGKILKGDRTWGDLPVAETLPPGVIAHFATNTAPSGWLKANGALVSRTTYAALFAVIGTTFGAGDGSTTFNIPDLRGEFLRGLDDGRGVDAGRANGSSQSSQNLSHNHGGLDGAAGGHSHAISSSIATASTGVNTNNKEASITGSNGLTPNTDAVAAHQHSISSDGGAEARPRNVALLVCIKY